MIKTFADRYPLIGPFLWGLSLQYYVIQLVVARYWPSHYSLVHNTISDLGNTVCGRYAGRFVCSPLHGLMNASFITLGITMAFGSLLIYRQFSENHGSFIAFTLMGIGGLGTVLVGLFPENSPGAVHFLGAALPFLAGNVAIVLLGLVLDITKALRIYTLASGAVALGALWLFITHNYYGIGIGGMERLISYPQTSWLIGFGVYVIMNPQLQVSPLLNNN